MKKRYPKAGKYLQFEANADGSFNITDLLEMAEYTVPDRIGHFLIGLDGKTDPFTLLPGEDKEDVIALLAALRMKKLIVLHPFFSLFKFAFSFKFPEVKKGGKLEKAARLMNRLLMMLFIPVFVAGVVSFAKSWFICCIDTDLPLLLGVLFGSFFTSIFHEFAHAAAAIDYQEKVNRIGATFKPGNAFFYVSYAEKLTSKNKLKQAQISAAGVEMDLLTSGLILIIVSHIGWSVIGSFLFGTVLTQLIMDIFCIILPGGNDGTQMLSSLVGGNIEAEQKGLVPALFTGKIYGKRAREEWTGISVCLTNSFMKYANPAFTFLLIWMVMIYVV